MPDDIEESTLLTLDYHQCPISIWMPSDANFQAHKVRYTCVGLDVTTRNDLVQKTLGGMNKKNWRARVQTFIDRLFQIGDIRGMTTIGHTAIF